MRSAIIISLLDAVAPLVSTRTTETSVDAMHATMPRYLNSAAKSFQNLSSPLKIDTWDGLNCQGAGLAYTEFNDSVLALNVSNFFVSRSFRLNRTLQGQEQLDLSVTNDYATWYHNKDQLSPNSSSCTNFWNSFYAVNGSTACQNTSPFTCHRLWNNPGLWMWWFSKFGIGLTDTHWGTLPGPRRHLSADSLLSKPHQSEGRSIMPFVLYHLYYAAICYNDH